MTLDEIRKTKAGQDPRNAHLFAVGGLEADRPKPTALRSLEQGVQEPARGKASVGLRIVLTSYRKRLLDEHDNLRFSVKPLVDAIADTLRLPDSHPSIIWEYHQCKTSGPEGVAVSLSTFQL